MDPLSPSLPPDWAELDAYFAGELNADAARAVRAYLAKHPDIEASLRRPDAFVPPAHATRAVDTAAMWRRMERRVMDAPRPAARAPRRYVVPAIAALAAAALLAVGVGRWRAGGDDAQSTTREFATRPGQRASVELADGSTALLAPASRIVVRASGRDVREVRLDGEAYFTVRGKSDVPFVVRAGDGIVRVLGTSFAVRRYETDSAVRIVVASGRVSVSDRDDRDGVGVILGAADLAQLGPGNRVVVTRGVALDDELAWRNGQLRVRNVTVAALVADLERVYDLEIRVPDSALMRLPVTASFHQTTPDGMLDVLSALLNVDVHRDGRTVTLLKRTGR